MCAVVSVIFGVCESVRVSLFVVMSFKSKINQLPIRTPSVVTNDMTVL
jgi:hypothetical protein